MIASPPPTSLSSQYQIEAPDLSILESFGHPVDDHHIVWKMYVNEATIHDNTMLDALNRSMDILLVFSGLFSAVATAFIVLVQQTLISRSLEPQFAKDIPAEVVLDIPFSRPLALMYISLFLSLGISAGAVLTKQWILEYQRRVKKYQVPAEQAKHRQAMYDSWLQWYIPEFASLLGTLVLVALLTLFVSFTLYLYGPDDVSLTPFGTLNPTKVDQTYYDIAGFALAILLFIVVFSTVTGYIISHCPYKSPASTVAQVIADNVLHPLNLLYSFVHPLAAVASFVGIFSVNNGQNLTILFSGFGCFIISAWLIVRFSRRSRIPKVWRIWQTLLLSLGLSAFLYTCIILLSRTWSDDSPWLILVIILPFGFLLLCLSIHAPSSKDFPILAVMGSSLGITILLCLAWHSWWWPALQWTDAPTRLVPVAVFMTALIPLASSYAEVDDESLIEAEALAWIIRYSSNLDVIHTALGCVPSLANTPTRRLVILSSISHTLSHLIQSTSILPSTQHDNANTSGASYHGLSSDYDIKMEFYLSCFGYLLQDPWSTRYWCRVLGVPHSGPPPGLIKTLTALTIHKNANLRALSSLVVLQCQRGSLELTSPPLSDWPSSDFSSWSTNRTVAINQTRELAARVCRAYQDQEFSHASILHLLQYCSDILRLDDPRLRHLILLLVCAALSDASARRFLMLPSRSQSSPALLAPRAMLLLTHFRSKILDADLGCESATRLVDKVMEQLLLNLESYFSKTKTPSDKERFVAELGHNQTESLEKAQHGLFDVINGDEWPIAVKNAAVLALGELIAVEVQSAPSSTLDTLITTKTMRIKEMLGWQSSFLGDSEWDSALQHLNMIHASSLQPPPYRHGHLRLSAIRVTGMLLEQWAKHGLEVICDLFNDHLPALASELVWSLSYSQDSRAVVLNLIYSLPLSMLSLPPPPKKHNSILDMLLRKPSKDLEALTIPDALIRLLPISNANQTNRIHDQLLEPTHRFGSSLLTAGFPSILLEHILDPDLSPPSIVQVTLALLQRLTNHDPFCRHIIRSAQLQTLAAIPSYPGNTFVGRSARLLALEIIGGLWDKSTQGKQSKRELEERMRSTMGGIARGIQVSLDLRVKIDLKFVREWTRRLEDVLGQAPTDIRLVNELEMVDALRRACVALEVDNQHVANERMMLWRSLTVLKRKVGVVVPVSYQCILFTELQRRGVDNY